VSQNEIIVRFDAVSFKYGHNNPILDDTDNSDTKPELVPEHVLESMGLMKDYSKFVDAGKNKTSQDQEWTKLREQRQKILNETIKR